MDIVSTLHVLLLRSIQTNPCRDNDIEGIIEPNFAVDDEKFGERRTIDLIPGGEDIPVTNENKGRYVE